MSKKQDVIDKLKEIGVEFKIVEHEAAFTVEDMMKLDFPESAVIAKNLFLRDAKGKRHFLLVAESNQSINIKELQDKFDSTRLSFGSDERLDKYLGLTKGSVSPLGLINDPEQNVELFIDENLRNCEILGIHPNDNTATVFMSCDDLIKFSKTTGHDVNFIKIT